MTDPARARAAMVDGLRRSGTTDPEVLAAFAAVPRHLFLPDVPVDAAYADRAVPTQVVDGVAVSSASQPGMMATMLEQLDVVPGQRVLEIGAGTGYNAALLARLTGADGGCGAVTSIDIDADLVEGAAEHLAAAGVPGVDLRVGDGAFGVPDAAPYDRIVLTVGSPDVRPEWVAQLAPGGRLLLPLAVRGSQLSVAFDLLPDGVLRSRSVVGCGFVRLRGAGAGADPRRTLRDGWLVQSGEGAEPDPAELAALVAHLDDPGDPRPLPPGVAVPEGWPGVWDGLAFWLMLTAPGAVRLLTERIEEAPGRWFLPAGEHRITVALPGPDGVAALTRDPPGVRGFGPGGDAAADRLLGCVQGWLDAGSPHARDLTVFAVPAGAELPAPGAVVEKELCRLVVTTGHAG